MPQIGHHRRFTANHTWYVDWAGRQLFLKANPNRVEADQEIIGHARIRARYSIPALLSTKRLGRWTVLTYERWPCLGHDTGLLLDEITRAELTRDATRLDACLDDILGRYRTVVADTIQLAAFGDTISKLYGDRLAGGGRLDHYYGTDTPWLTLPDGWQLRPSELAGTHLMVNGREHQIDLAHVLVELRVHFAARNPTWAGITQGDPTDFNIGWSPQAGAVWFDYDTGGLNAVAGEFACFLIDQRLHSAWLTPTYNPAAFRDHPSALVAAALHPPTARVERDGRSGLRIDYTHQPGRARQHATRRYLREVVEPISANLRVGDLMGWLRPYLVMRLLAVYHLGQLHPRDTALVLGLIADVLHPDTTLHDFLALTTSRSESAP